MRFTISGSEKLAVLLEDWIACDGCWVESSFYKRVTQRTTTSRRGCRVWLTREQIRIKYGGSHKIADMICDSKLNDPESFKHQTKVHPDCPDNEAGLYCMFFGSVAQCRIKLWCACCVH